MMRWRHSLILGLLAALTACETPDWLGGSERVIKRAPGERIDVVLNLTHLTPDSEVAEVPIEIPDQANLDSWKNHNDALRVPHLGLTGITKSNSVRVGDGNGFSRSIGPAPVISSGIVVAMDALGILSAHDESDIEKVLWTNHDGVDEDAGETFGGGLAIDEGTLYATTGKGGVRAVDLKTGKLKWKTSVGAPVRGAPAAGAGVVAVITADNQTIALDAEKGTPRWSQRGIHEAASYVSNVAPVIVNGVVIAAYSSGEIFAIRAESGNVIWNDTLGSSIRTRAAAVFSGIDADPIVGEDVVVAISAAGEVQASALANGRPLWQKRIGGHNPLWSAGNALFVLTDTHDVAALFKKDGSVRWSHSFTQLDKRDATHDITPALYGPILAGNAVLVLDAKGVLTTLKPQDGAVLNTYDLAEDPVTAPLVVNGALYYVTKDAKLHRYN